LLLAALLTALAATPAQAAPPCDEVFFDCSRDPLVFDGKNLKQLRADHRNERWILKNCRPEQAMPVGCDWKRSLGRAPASSASTTVVSAPYAPAYAPAAYPGTAPTVARDARGRIGPSPAPVREEAVAVTDTGPFSAEIQAAAARYRLPAQLVRAVMTVESGGNPLIVSHKGAVGLMQLIPATAQAMGVEDPYDAAQNVAGGARFLRVLANRFDGDLVKVLSAYHAGSTRVLGRDATPFAATDDYVRKVLRLYYQLRDARAG